MDLEQIVELIHGRLRETGMVSHNAPTDDGLMNIARNVWMEHRALPELPVMAIIARWTDPQGNVTDEERRFWRRQGL